MIKKTLKVLSVILSLVIACACIACDGCNDEESTTNVSLKTPGAVISNGGGVIETENYYYYVNGSTANTDDNTYGTPKKGAIAVVAKNNLSAPEIVVPKIVITEDYSAGIYLYGEYLYYGTQTVKKDKDGNIPYGTLEFQKAKIDGSSVEEVFTLQDGLATEFRIVENDGKVIIFYTVIETVDEVDKVNLYKYDGSSSLVAEDVSSIKFVDNANLDKAVAIYTKTVKDADSEQNFAYNEVYAVKPDGTTKKVLTGDRATTGYVSHVTYTLTVVRDGYVFFSESAKSTLNEVSSMVVSLADFVNKSQSAITNKVITNKDANVSTAYIGEGLEDIYYVYSPDETSAYIVSGSFFSDEMIILSNQAANDILAEKGDYIYYVDANSCLTAVKSNKKDPEDPIKLSKDVINLTWYKNGFVGDKLFFVDSSNFGKDYYKVIDVSVIANAENIETDEETDVKSLKEDKIANIAIYSDADVAGIFEEHLVTFQGNAYGNNQRVKVRDDNGALILKDGKIVDEDFEKIVAMYNNLTDSQKAFLSESGVSGYNSYVECFKVNNILLPLEGFNDANKNGLSDTDAAAWETKIASVKTAIDAYIDGNKADFEKVFNMVDNNLLWEYYGNATVKGALDWYNERVA